MLQRGLAVLLSVCMLAGGISDTAYAMNPQMNVHTVSDLQDRADDRDTDANISAIQEGGGGSGSEDAGNEPTEGGIGTAGTGVENDTTGTGGGNNDDNTSGDVSGDDDGMQEDGEAGDNVTPEDGIGGEGDSGTQEDVSDDDSDAPEDGSEDDSNVPEGSLGGDGTSEDENDSEAEEDAPEDGDLTDSDAAVDEAGVEEVDPETLSANSVSALNIKEEEFMLTTDAPQTVTLDAGERQWLSFTAPQDGLYRFYSTSEDDSGKNVFAFLFHQKTDNENGSFGADYGTGQNGNFDCPYRMEMNETVYVLVRFGSPVASGTFTVNAQKVEVPELTVTKNDEGNYTLQSDSYRLHLTLTPSYSMVTAGMELRQADGSALTGGNSYNIYYRYTYDNRSGGTSHLHNWTHLDSSGEYKSEYKIQNIAEGGRFLITELQILDSSDNILVVLGAGGQAITVNTLDTEKPGVITEVSAEDASITVKAEFMSSPNGRLRYRRKEESEWTSVNRVVYSYTAVTFAAEPDTDYVVELTDADMKTVYDTTEIRTKAFAAADIRAEAVDITSSGAVIKVTIGSYTGNKRYICARVSYTDSMGDSQTDTGRVSADRIADGSIDLVLSNLEAGTEYQDLEVEMDDTDSDAMEYVAHRTKVSFTTAASTITGEQINVTAVPDAQDGSRAVLKVALRDASEGSYSYTAKYRVAGSRDWKESYILKGTLGSYNNYAEELNLAYLLGNTEYEVQVMVDGVLKAAAFATVSTAVVPEVEVKPLMQGVQVTATLTGTAALSDGYTISARCYNETTGSWSGIYYSDYDDTCLTADNNWKSTVIFYSDSMRPNVENTWRVEINGNKTGGVYEKYFVFKAVQQEITLTPEKTMYTTALLKAVMTARDESLAYAKDGLVYYREQGTSQWIKGDLCSYAYESGDEIYLSGLKEDTEYEVKLVPWNYPDDILAQISFRTLKDTRSLSVSADTRRYTSAQVAWDFDSGTNEQGIYSYIYLYYRAKGAAKWICAASVIKQTDYRDELSLTGLQPGTVYEVLAEIKHNGNSDIAGENMVRDAKTEFTTVAVDHELTAEPVSEEIKPASVTFDVQLTKPTGVLDSRMKAVVALEPADGEDIRSKEVYLGKDNQYKTKLVMGDLLPDTKYAVRAELYESENNYWFALRHYDMGEVTTAKADLPDSLTISEETLTLNQGTAQRLTVTVRPQEAAAGLIWTSSDETVATAGVDGTVTAHKAGEADIIAAAAGDAADGQEKVSAVCHVTVRDYTIRVKNADDSYDSIPTLLSRTQKRTLVVYDEAAGADLTGVTWVSNNLHTANISDEGLLEPRNYGQTYITAETADGITLKTEAIRVINEIQGFSITRPETNHSAYEAVRTAEAVYQVAAGETYQVGCVLSPAYTDRYNSSVSMAGSEFNWSTDNSAVTVRALETGRLTEITIPATVSGPVQVTAVMKDEVYRHKSFSITLDVLKKPDVEVLPDTYIWLDYSNKLKDAALPENWQWKEQSTLLYGTGAKVFTACYVETGYFPYETGVAVHAERIGNTLSVKQTGADGKDIISDNYSADKKAYIVKKEMPLKVKTGSLAGSAPALLYEQSALAPAAKDAAKVSVSAPDADGYYSVTASAKGTYTVSAAVALKKAAFKKQDGAYVLTEGAKVKDTTVSLKFMAVDAAPVQKIIFAVADDSPEKVTISEEGAIEYEITAANANTKQNARVIHIDVTAVDQDGNRVENPKIDYKVSDAAVVKLKKEGTDRLVLTIPKGADGLAKVNATAKDALGRSAQFAVRVKDYTPRVTAFEVDINENYTYSKQIAQIVLPYEKDGSDQIEQISLVKTEDVSDVVDGLVIRRSAISGSYMYRATVGVTDKEQIKQKGNLKYYLAIQTKAYGGPVFVPVRIRLEEGTPAVTVKQSKKVNVFYTDTTHFMSYDEVSMGLVKVSAPVRIESVRWIAGDDSESAVKKEFIIENWSLSIMKNGKNTKEYMIQQNRPVLDSSGKPSAAAVKGTLYIRLQGYGEEIAKPLTIQTVYKKPKLRVADYKVCPALGEVSDQQRIYSNAKKTDNCMRKGNYTVWTNYSDILCADEEVEIEIVEAENVMLKYSGTKDRKTQLTLYSDRWHEPLTVPVKIKSVKSGVKISPAAVTLNAAYPSETTQTTASAWFYNAATGTRLNVSDIGIKGANARAQQMLDQGLINMNCMYSRLLVSLNYAKAMGSDPIRPGSYKYKLTPYYGDTELSSFTLTVKVIDKEATVKVKAKGAIDLLRLNNNSDGYNKFCNPVVTVTPVFRNLDSSYMVAKAELCGAYKDLFQIADFDQNGVLKIVPASIGGLKAGKRYTLSVKYTVRDEYGGNGKLITVVSNTFTIKPKQSMPKLTLSVKQLTLYASAKGENKGQEMTLSVPNTFGQGYYAIEDVNGSLDVNKDGKADLVVKATGVRPFGSEVTVQVYILDADAVKASTKGINYKIPVTVECVGRDGVSKDASTTVSVVVKK